MTLSKLPSLSALRAFEAAARLGSFTRAAEELNVTHAAIAHHVRSLEAEFSETLLVRHGRGMVPTILGQQLAYDLNDGFSTIGEGVEKIRENRMQRPLNISVTPAFASNWLMPRIGEFWASHPEVELNINPTVSLVDLKRDGFDMAIRYGDGNWSGAEQQKLSIGGFWVVAHPELLIDRPAKCLQDVMDLPWVLEHHMNEYRTIIEQAGVEFDGLNLTLLSTNELVLSAARAKLGVTLQPRSLVESSVQSGALTKVCTLRHEGLGYYMLHLADRKPKGLRIFMKWLSDKARLEHG